MDSHLRMIQQDFASSDDDKDLFRTQFTNIEYPRIKNGSSGEKHASKSETLLSMQDRLESVTITTEYGDCTSSSTVQLEQIIRTSSSENDNEKKHPNWTLQNRFSIWLEKSSRSVVLFAGASLAGSVLLVNTIMLLVALTSKRRQGLESSPIYDGNCRKANHISVMSHVLINILSTLLLGASNFAMQVLAAPTREEVDRAHSRGKWLDIGVPSLHNVRYISNTRKALYILLCLSSIPLHLLYNSAIFTVTSTNDVDAIMVYEDFLNSSAPYFTNQLTSGREFPDGFNSTLQRFADDAYTWKNFSRVECAKQYRNLEVVQGYSSLVMVVEHNDDDFVDTTKGFILIVALSSNTYYDELGLLWNPSNKLSVDNFAATWVDYKNGTTPQTIYLPIKYCLAKPEHDHCQLHFSPAILIVVIIFNLLKTICLFITAYRFGSGDRTLVVIGDAIESFLNHPDDTVKGFCTADRFYYTGIFGKDALAPIKAKVRSCFRTWVQRRCDSKFASKHLSSTFAHKFEGRDSRRWCVGVSKSRWYTTVFFISIALITGSWCLQQVTQTNDSTLANIWSRGLGGIYGDATLDVLTGVKSTVSMIVFVNAPQVALSTLFFLYNALLTSMLVNLEYVSYSTTKKALRVSTPRVNSLQRSTYYLQMPYRYGLPLLGFSCALHYTMSQSLFVVDLMAFNEGVYDPSKGGSTMFYSVLGIILTLFLGIMALVIMFTVGFFRRYRGLMPLGGTCSASIAAACWRPSHDCDAALGEVQWGELVEPTQSHQPRRQEDNKAEQEQQLPIPHLCFTSMEVTPARTSYNLGSYRYVNEDCWKAYSVSNLTFVVPDDSIAGCIWTKV